MDLILPSGFCERTIDRLFFVQLSRHGVDDKRVQQWYAYKLWQDYASAGGKVRVLEGFEVSDALKGDALAKALENIAEVQIIELYVEWKGAPGAFVASAIDAGFLTLKTSSEGVVSLECEGFYPLNTTKTAMQRKGGMAKAVAHRRNLGKQDAIGGLMYYENSEGFSTSQLSAAEREQVVACIATLSRCTNQPAPDLKAYTAELVQNVHGLITLCDEERLNKLYMKVYEHKEEWVEVKQIPLLVGKLLGMLKSGEV